MTRSLLPSRRRCERPFAGTMLTAGLALTRLAIMGLAILGLAISTVDGFAAEPPPPARLAIDLGSERILEEAHLDSPRPPASLTKLMTAFVAFDALESGAITRETMVTVSAWAAGRPPVGAGLRAGDEIPFGDLLDAALIASANDAASAVAEAVAGQEAAFVARMNEKAAALGMTQTRFLTASGLPKPGQRITARDAALLARALVARHGGRAGVFAQTRTRIAGRTLLSTNPLLGRYAGAIGMKTGFTCAAGYNLVALAERGGRRILAVGLGYPGRGERNGAVVALLDRAFASAAGRGVRFAALDPDPRRAPPRPLRAYRGCAPGGSSTPKGYAAFLGAYAKRGAAAQAIRIARRAAKGSGATYLARRSRDRRWAAMLHSLRASDATRVCLAARQTGRYCVRLSPSALRGKRGFWR